MGETSRRSLSKKIRFEVFKRDSFTCQYCGRKAPEVILEVDHIVPVSKGGTDDLLNLITSCRECNAGKSNRELSDGTVLEKRRRQLEELQERREQIEMMLQWQRELLALEQQTVEEVAAFWADLVYPYHLTEKGMRGLRNLIKQFGVSEVLEAMRIATEQYIEYDKEGVPTQESVELAWGKVKGICIVRRAQAKKPYLQDLLYIRGILRNRLSYVNMRLALELLEKAYKAGAEVEQLKEHALSVRNWTQWRGEIESFIEQNSEENALSSASSG